ncbi:MAG: adenylyltransferase/cytidyltransferase family protein, partial [Clostridia bacterium]|nr:adenylyltransferase/cytidyltransferase family protein [Clostridia bacterium]
MSRNPSVAVFGTFDGLHKGHRAVLNAALSFKQYEPVAITFDEPPRRQSAGAFVPMLMPSERKKEIMKELGFKTIEVLDYNEIHDMLAEEFLNSMFRKFNIKVAVCGFNYRFGKGAEGDAELLTSYCHTHSAEAVVCPGTDFSGQIISSTLIRNLISDGQISFANTLLDSEFCYATEVIHGDERGRTLGFPTINQPLNENLVTPKFGVYASRVKVGGVDYAAVTNIGIRPTFLLKKPLSETYIIGFEGDLYGEIPEITL